MRLWMYSCMLLLLGLKALQTDSSGDNKLGKKQPHSLRMHFPYKVFGSDDNDEMSKSSRLNWRRSMRKEHMKRNYVNYSFAQDQEDIWLYENWFYKMEGGVILESGALDGIMYSTSFMFEKVANYMPIHIEADPRNYNRLVRNRENSINIHAALCSEPQLLHFTNDKGPEVQGFVEFMAPAFLRKFHNKIYKNKIPLSDLPTVQCVSVNKILKEINVSHVDIWILDVEGAELSVLQAIDFAHLSVSAIVVECDNTNEPKDEKKVSLLKNNGYICSKIQRNCFCRHNQFTPTSAPDGEKIYTGSRNNLSKTYSRKSLRYIN